MGALFRPCVPQSELVRLFVCLWLGSLPAVRPALTWSRSVLWLGSLPAVRPALTWSRSVLWLASLPRRCRCAPPSRPRAATAAALGAAGAGAGRRVDPAAGEGGAGAADAGAADSAAAPGSRRQQPGPAARPAGRGTSASPGTPEDGAAHIHLVKLVSLGRTPQGGGGGGWRPLGLRNC